MEVGGVGPVDYLERLVITGGGGELFKSCLGAEGNLDVSPCRKLKKSVVQACVKTMQRARFDLLPTHHGLLIGGVQANGQNARTTVAVNQ